MELGINCELTRRSWEKIKEAGERACGSNWEEIFKEWKGTGTRTGKGGGNNLVRNLTTWKHLKGHSEGTDNELRI